MGPLKGGRCCRTGCLLADANRPPRGIALGKERNLRARGEIPSVISGGIS